MEFDRQPFGAGLMPDAGGRFDDAVGNARGHFINRFEQRFLAGSQLDPIHRHTRSDVGNAADVNPRPLKARFVPTANLCR